jgi:ABC-type multidrug transport system ATPase subunit
MGEPNVLLLDEPTNDLDVDTLTALEDLLDGWAGSLVVVSHDRYFVERVCDSAVALLGDGRLRDLPGGVEQYLELRRAATTSAGPVERAPASVSRRPDRPVDDGGTPAPSAADVRSARKEIGRIERRLERIVAEETRLHDELAAHATDHVRVADLDTRLRALVAERDDLEERWLTLAEDAG